MKPILTSLVLIAGALLSGCAIYNRHVVFAPVGPAPGQYATAGTETGDGSLVVYSAYDVNPIINSRDSSRPVYTDYRIQTADGQPLKYVHNDSGTILQKPVQVQLPAGQYRVLAHANGYGEVTVPVTVAAAELTIVHLESNISLAR